jgi:hypothetical protein
MGVKLGGIILKKKNENMKKMYSCNSLLTTVVSCDNLHKI